jgi:hypothetical protein
MLSRSAIWWFAASSQTAWPRQQRAFENAGQAVDFAPGVAESDLVHRSA